MYNIEWNKVYFHKQMAQYPDNALIRFVAHYYYGAPDRKEVKFLDVGCGVGASTWYLAREGFSVAAIDGSYIATNKLRDRLKKDNLEAFIACTDITKLEFKPDYFDCVVDVASLCYVPQDEIASMVKKLHTVLKPGGRIFSIAPSYLSEKAPYNHTIDGVDLKARFQTWDDLNSIFKDFKDHHYYMATYNTNGYAVSTYVFDAVKA